MENVEWVAVNSELDGNRHPTGEVGLRMFPDKQSYYNAATNAFVEDQVERSIVRVRARLNAPIPNVPIKFRFYDPDDPSSDHPDVDSNAVLGGDNRQLLNNPTVSAVTDAAGVAEVAFRVSKRPGDNFRVAAALEETDFAPLSDNTVPASDEPAAGFSGKLSRLLTVWRTLHLEIGSMQLGGLEDNRESGTLHDATWQPAANPLGQGSTILEVEDVGDDWDKDQQFFAGWIEIHGVADPLRVIDFQSTLGQYDYVEVLGDLATGASDVSGLGYRLYDDDVVLEAQQNGTTVLSYAAKLPELPDTSKLLDELAVAYVLLDRIDDTSNSGIAFDRDIDNISEFTAVVDSDSQIPVSVVSDDYLAFSIVSAFQGPPSRDLDAEDDAVLALQR